MDIQELLQKMKTQKLSEEEKQAFVKLVNDDFEKLKKEEPKKYLELLQKLNEIITDLNQNIAQIKS